MSFVDSVVVMGHAYLTRVNYIVKLHVIKDKFFEYYIYILSMRPKTNI